MTALESFAAFTNRLPVIPGGMLRRWAGLTRLCLWTNQLAALPPEVGCMHSLQVSTRPRPHGIICTTSKTAAS